MKAQINLSDARKKQKGYGENKSYNPVKLIFKIFIL